MGKYVVIKSEMSKIRQFIEEFTGFWLVTIDNTLWLTQKLTNSAQWDPGDMRETPPSANWLDAAQKCESQHNA